MEKTLLHCCCGPCSVSCILPLREEGIEPVAFWYNPNIHPFKEYEARRDSLIAYADITKTKFIIDEDYGLREFVKAVAHNIEGRCSFCYRVRLEKTAKFAAENGFDSFTSTLLASLYQDHNGIKAAGEALAQKYGVKFLYKDFRPGFREGNNKARELELYMQKYCGCVFSEEDRYIKQIKKAKERFEI